jgi:hypothetical protein
VNKAGVFAMDMLPSSLAGVPLMMVGGTEFKAAKTLGLARGEIKKVIGAWAKGTFNSRGEKSKGQVSKYQII